MLAAPVPATSVESADHLSWVRTRLTLERDFRETVAQGFALIVTGFGSFAIFDGLAATHERADLPKAFALAATAIGVAVILLGIAHYRKMTAWVDDDEFGDLPKVTLPDDGRWLAMAAAAIVIGLISFVALVLTQ